jgi:hypothetical protein
MASYRRLDALYAMRNTLLSSGCSGSDSTSMDHQTSREALWWMLAWWALGGDKTGGIGNLAQVASTIVRDRAYKSQQK